MHDNKPSNAPPRFRKPGMRGVVESSTWQLFLFVLVLVASLTLLLATVKVALFSTLVTFLFVAIVGLVLCHFTKAQTGDHKLQILGTLWLIKLGITLFLLYVGWMPQLDPSSSVEWGYDPQRYYQEASDLMKNAFVFDGNLNYPGVLYYYAAIFYLFGYNPVIPALINAFVTLLGTLYLIRVAYELKGEEGPRDWTLAYLLLIPELLWYDVMTSRETLLAVLLLGAMLTAGRYIVRTSRPSFGATLIVVGTCLGAVLAVRPSMALPSAVAIALMVILLGTKSRYGLVPTILIVGVSLSLLVLGPYVQSLLGGYDFDFIQSIKLAQSFEDNIAVQAEWSEQSIGILLAPNNTWQSLVYLPPRMVLYLAAPLPNVVVPVAELMAGSYAAWQRLMTIPSSVLNLLVMPYAMSGFAVAWQRRRWQPAPLVLHFSFWITFMAIAGGNIIIHERYRVMMTLLLFACAWMGYTSCPRPLVRFYAYIWFSILASGAILYVIYKMFL